MVFSRRPKYRKHIVIIAVVLAIVLMVYNYLYIDHIDIRINAGEDRLFIVNTSITYNEVLASSTRNSNMRLVKSGSVQSLPLKPDNLIFFGSVFVWIYHPEYILQQQQYSARTFTGKIEFPEFEPIPWTTITTNRVKIHVSDPPSDISRFHTYRQDIESGRLVRIVDVLGHMRNFKESYIPLYREKRSMEQLRQFLPVLRKQVEYTTNNIEVDYQELKSHDQEYLWQINQYLADIEKILG